MTTITIHDVPDDVTERLRSRAERRGLSMEAEIHSALRDAASVDDIDDTAERRRDWPDAVKAAQAAFAPYRDLTRSAVDELIAERRDEARRADR